ncbi:DUF1800 domain-containing protein [Roseateles violae]|uniref:DUF1800 domain-containing protein n=1 Tax=Roseateles violae TaxID=3058042 RepID=A0ABT8DVP5_9BURK|nr:DUF1800 domain-containing protein [Pelomonas sp. PFR6]MDN3920221.1 DUF1800 domain-containing protein [Pelomonas sp. PFR6]
MSTFTTDRPPPAPPLPADGAARAILPPSLAAALSGCGGGGGAEMAVPPPPASPPPPPPPAAAALSDADAARLLTQAGFAASDAGIAAVKAKGYAAWLDEQFAIAPGISNYDWMISKGYGAAEYRGSTSGIDNALWRSWLSAPDALRQRVTLALSEIFVVSIDNVPVAWSSLTVAAYVDLLAEHAFGSFRELLGAVTLSNAMGVFLSMRGNQKEDAKTGRMPDENYAREVMQLFTIGLYELNPDGSPRLDEAGKPRETYTPATISELARVFTGWELADTAGTDPAAVRRPMVHLSGRFSAGAKKALDVDIPASADGPTALRLALDALAAHPNVGPFIGRQLIQRLVCSQPSPAYVQRVAAVFDNNGAGRRGDLRAVIRAILLDAEARQPAASPSSGRLREPMLRFIQWARSFGVSSASGLWSVGDTSNPATRLGQSPLRSPSAFNFFRPGYVPPNSTLGEHRVTAPEFQLCNESSVAGYLNFMQTVIAGEFAELRPDYTAELALAGDATALVERVALLLAGGDLQPATRSTIAAAVAQIRADTEAGRASRVHATLLLVMASPDYQVQK